MAKLVRSLLVGSMFAVTAWGMENEIKVTLSAGENDRIGMTLGENVLVKNTQVSTAKHPQLPYSPLIESEQQKMLSEKQKREALEKKAFESMRQGILYPSVPRNLDHVVIPKELLLSAATISGQKKPVVGVPASVENKHKSTCWKSNLLVSSTVATLSLLGSYAARLLVPQFRTGMPSRSMKFITPVAGLLGTLLFNKFTKQNPGFVSTQKVRGVKARTFGLDNACNIAATLAPHLVSGYLVTRM